MADTTLAKVKQLAEKLPPEEQRLLAQLLLQDLNDQGLSYLPKTKLSKEDIQRDLDKAWGAWGNKTADEVDLKIKEMRRKEWSRDWPQER